MLYTKERKSESALCISCCGKGEDTKFLIAFIYITVAAFFDKKQFRVPNWLCMMGVINGLSYHLLVDGLHTFFRYLGGMLLPVFCLWILFYFRMIGAGDIKLFAVIGSFIGKDVVWVMIYSMVVNGIFSFFILYRERAFVQRFLYFGEYIKNFFWIKERNPYCGVDWKSSPFAIHFTVGIWIGFLLYLVKVLV